ncbi:hypothetical protein FA13DRAFT_1058363 [Coprinellus micaceus]|jgi:hypothetical protein|uniref:Uncharacterized protein n=1 Tax=Coprinellus micaceus TaxID=71717 RepID=A0A4Y7RLR4_COPMI|nr:hypothetical protein FA13DRAFT_1058363 [Coprinellus micaceus]
MRLGFLKSYPSPSCFSCFFPVLSETPFIIHNITLLPFVLPGCLIHHAQVLSLDLELASVSKTTNHKHKRAWAYIVMFTRNMANLTHYLTIASQSGGVQLNSSQVKDVARAPRHGAKTPVDSFTPLSRHI